MHGLYGESWDEEEDDEEDKDSDSKSILCKRERERERVTVLWFYKLIEKRVPLKRVWGLWLKKTQELYNYIVLGRWEFGEHVRHKALCPRGKMNEV